MRPAQRRTTGANERPSNRQLQGARRRDIRDPGRQRLGKVHADPDPLHAATAGPRAACVVFGHDVVKEPGAVRPLLNRVSADPSFFKPMSALENLLFFGRAYGISGPEVRQKSQAILPRLGLDDEHAREPMLHLSRGQQQKVAVARAFLSAPRLMLLDEPTTGLDPRSKREVQAFITEVRRESQTTILLTTHDMDEAEQLCDRIGFLSGGKLVAEGTPLELRKQVAAGRSLEEVDMETVFLELTGRSIEEDEDEDEGEAHRRR